MEGILDHMLLKFIIKSLIFNPAVLEFDRVCDSLALNIENCQLINCFSD
jgi:hypothetical protein